MTGEVGVAEQRALFIGIDDYKFAPLSSCVNDARAMRDELVRLGVFSPAECTLMTSPPVGGSAAIPTRRAVLDWLKALYKRDAPIDRLLVFFAGHGMSVRLGREAGTLRTVLIPAGIDNLEDAGGDLIDTDELLGRFARRGAREQYWIIDACRNLPPDGVVPNVAAVPWDVPVDGDFRDAFEMARSVLYAVAPLGQAQASAGNHGYLTVHVLDGLACRGDASWGAAAVYDERQDSWLIDLQSLGEYAKNRIKLALPDGWQREYALPRVWSGEKVPSPLRNAGALERRPFVLRVEPAAAASAINASLSVKRNPVAVWPPAAIGAPVPLPPEIYRLAATLSPGATGWMSPTVADPVVDLRQQGEACVHLERSPAAEDGLALVRAVPTEIATPTLTEQSVQPVLVRGDGSTVTGPLSRARFMETPAGYHYAAMPPQVTVRAIDPGASVRLTKLSGRRDRKVGVIGVPITIEAGVWRIEVLIGDDVIAVREEDFGISQRYEISATAQITPALAALMPEASREGLAASVEPSETIGPMQGAVLPTLLPMLALKPFDASGVVLQRFSAGLGIPHVLLETSTPAAIAVALEGAWEHFSDTSLPVPAASLGTEALTVWREQSGRISVLVCPDQRREDRVHLSLPGWGAIELAAPRVDGFCTTLAATLWADGRHDVSISLFRLPPGDDVVRPGRLARALTIASRLYRARASLDDVNYDVFTALASGSWGDPVLGALAWFGRRRSLISADVGAPQHQPLDGRQEAVRAFLATHVPEFPDARVIAALSAEASARDAAVDMLLDDFKLQQPVLADAVSVLARRAIARGILGHWSVKRYQLLDDDAVFNVVPLTSAKSFRGGS